MKIAFYGANRVAKDFYYVLKDTDMEVSLCFAHLWMNTKQERRAKKLCRSCYFGAPGMGAPKSPF